jgi:excisionase family DNA binding protein
MLRSVLIPDAAELLGVSRRTVYYRIRAGTLKTVRTRGGSQRVLMESIEAALRAERQRRSVTARLALRDSPAPDGPSTGYFGAAEGVVLAIR